MLDSLTLPEMLPFATALGLLAGLLLLEIIALIFGATLVGDAGSPDADLDLDGDFDTDLDAEIDAPGAAGGWLSWLGMGRVPFLIWFATVLVGFGLTGLIGQTALNATFGAMLPATLAGLLALPVALIFGREVGAVVAHLMPKSETSAISRRRLGGQVGVITQGTARLDSPVEARLRDRHGNLHYVRVIPAAGEAPIPQGTDVLILRAGDGTFTATPLAD
ncbi:MAG: OB-fold-containig protein [Pseudomonadota bacterium]